LGLEEGSMRILVLVSAMLIASMANPSGAELRLPAVDMSSARVATGEQAQARLYERLVQAEDDGISATQSARVITRFQIGFDVSDFARTGDRIWLVHVVALDDATVKRVAWINAESGAVIFLLEDQGESAMEELQLLCAMARTEFVVGETLPPPKVTIRNNGEADVDLVGPTITVIACTLVQPDNAGIAMVLAMPTGRDPRQMPSQKLKAGAAMEFTPEGIWHYVDEGGFQPYVFQHEGSYAFTCQYEGLTSKTIAITVRGTTCEPAGATTSP
jgi:hypothetical protein